MKKKKNPEIKHGNKEELKGHIFTGIAIVKIYLVALAIRVPKRLSVYLKAS